VADAGTLQNGRYVLLEPIGEGAQGRTFDGVDKREGRPVAIKRFDVRGATSWKDVELAEREARVLQSLSHPKLPAYVDHFEEDGALYLVMEKIEGESLGAYRRRGGAMGQEEVLRLLGDASDVLDYLHARTPPVIHRDLKPGNVIRRPDGSFAFVDFGAVTGRLRPKGGSTVVGTFGYMAPEQVQGRALAASDVYAVGATAIAMLTGSEPEDLPHRGLMIDVRQALAATGGVETWSGGRLAVVLERMLEPDPDRRASRIAPLLAEPSTWERGPRRGNSRESRDPAYADRDSRHAQRRARREARRVERAARRGARWRGSAGHPFPWPARLVLAILFTVGIVAVSLATQVVVPLVLRVLSLFFAHRALTRAAQAVGHAGEVAVGGMRASRQWFFAGATWPDTADAPPEEAEEADEADQANEIAGPVPSARTGTRVQAADESRDAGGLRARVAEGKGDGDVEDAQEGESSDAGSSERARGAREASAARGKR
jgi:protein kinase-like protein